MFDMHDIIQEVCNEFPEIEQSSIEKICKTGLAGINKLMFSREELSIKSVKMDEIKFFIPCTPEQQDELTKKNRRRRYYKEIKKQNGKESK